MARSPTRNVRLALVAAALMVPAVVMVSYAPTLYRLFCAATGFGGTTQRAATIVRGTAPPVAAKGAPRIRILFDASVAPGLDWEFRPEQRSVEVTVGEPTKIYYFARNRTGKPTVGRATFNVTPYKAAPYFFKIQCFCFTDERLGPGESARMPVVLYVDKQILKDANTRDVHEITLFYTFFRKVTVKDGAAQTARDLKAGSKALDATLRRRGKAVFDNDAPRQ